LQTAVVTGAGRGIGREVALRLAARGYAVLATDVNELAARETADLLGEPAWSMSHDVRDPDAHRAVAEAALERGPVAVWVNNAGVFRGGNSWEHGDDHIRLMVETNVLGVMWGSNAAVAAMREAGGHVINLASMAALGPVPGLGVYSASKHAVLAYTVALQGELEAEGIGVRLHAVCPDIVGTDIARDETYPGWILASAPKIHDPGQIAERIVSLLDTDRLVLTHPRWRGWMMRSIGMFPRAALRMLPGMRRRAERGSPRAT
jgi:NAD(P)-dependent dehydrogenase (short-subunit alcohol dehydrogenase family)